MKRTALLLAAALLAAGCTTPPRTPAPAPAPASPPVTQTPTSVTDWNDRTFQLIKEQKWSEAIEAGQKAVAMDGQNAAAHFNLGRAYLGAGQGKEAAAELTRASTLTGGTNADVQYFLGQAWAAAGQPVMVVDVWARALEGPLAGDREIAAALQEYLRKQDYPLAVGDVDSDGKPDLLRIADNRFRITGGTGRVLYDAPIMAATPKEIPHRIKVHPVKDGAPLIHVEIPACPSAPQNAFFWFDGSKVIHVGDGGPCTTYQFGSDGTIQEGFRAGGIYLISVQRFEKGRFVDVGSKSRLMWAPRQDQIGYLLTSIVGSPLENPLELFATQQVFEEFQSHLGGAKWEFQQGGESGPDFVQVKPVRDGKTLGIANVYLQKDGSGNLRILRIAWP